MAKRSKSGVGSASGGIPSALCCIPKRLRPEMRVAAAVRACEINPQNNAPARRLAGIIKGFTPTREHIALVTSKYWGPQGVDLSVSFLEDRPAALRASILAHMNAWALEPRPGAPGANVRFRETDGVGEVRIAFESGDDGGYWSYLGTDILSIALDKPTLNLERFSMQTPEREFIRVVRHEAGHTLGFPHEHLRRELVQRIDRAKAIAYFKRTQEWTEEEVDAQVLTPLEESSIMGTERTDDRSIMCYNIPSEIAKDGISIVGGDNIDADDYGFAVQIYPPALAPRWPLPPGPDAEIPASCGGGPATVQINSGAAQITVTVPCGTRSPFTPPAVPLGRGGPPVARDFNQEQKHAIVQQCIQNAAPGSTFGRNTPLSSIGASPQSVASCVAASTGRFVPVSGGDTQNSIVGKL